MTGNTWTSSITNIHPNRIEIRGYEIGDLIGNVTFTEQIFLIITGNLPDIKTEKMFEALLCASIDHGAGTPSVLAARTAISGGAMINGAAAVGLLTLGEHHGAAVEKCMRAIEGLIEQYELGSTLDEGIEKLLSEFEKNKTKFPGIGHRVHTDDPRVNRLREIAIEYGFYGKYIACVDRISFILSKIKRETIPVNIDGIIAAILCEIRFPIEFGNVVFMISRMVGIFTHVNEEKYNQKPMRHIDPVQIKYDGIPYRELKRG